MNTLPSARGTPRPATLMAALSIVSIAVLPPFLMGCPGGGTACTEEARASVSISIVDDGGAPLPGATVTYQVDGGEVLTADCVSGDSTQCTEFVAGWEVEGTFSVVASLEGHEDATAEVTVGMTEDGCHVEGQVLTLELSPQDGI